MVTEQGSVELQHNMAAESEDVRDDDEDVDQWQQPQQQH